MKYKSVLMTHLDGGMHHLGIKKEHVAEKVVLIPDPMKVEYYASFMDDAKLMGDYREYVTYTGTYKGERLSIMSCGFGCMPMAIAIEELKHLDVTEVVKIDENVAIQDDIKCGEYIVAKGAVRGEGASVEYIDISYPAVADMDLLSRIIVNDDVKIGLFRSHDVENLESPYAPDGMNRIMKWTNMGVDVEDAETSSMFIVGACLRMKTASISLIKENYITGEKKENSKEAKKRLFEMAADALIKK